MARRLLCICLLALGALAPSTALAAKPAAAVVGKPTVSAVRVLQPGGGTGVVVSVLVHHPALASPARGVQAVGTTTIVLSRYEGDRNHAIAGGTASWGLPVDAADDVLYTVALNPRQSSAVIAASGAGVLRALVLVDERAKARGAAPARDGGFAQQDARVAATATAPIALPPLLAGGGRRVTITADAKGRSFAVAATIPVSGGRTLVLAPHALVPATGEPVELAGKASLLGADGAELATFAAPPGITLAVSPTGKRRGTLLWPAITLPGADPIDAGTALLSPPATH